MSLIRWRDRLFVLCRKAYAVPGLLESILIIALFTAIFMFAGCSFWRDAGENLPSGQPKIEDASKPETAAAKVARLEGELAKAKSEHEEERLAPLRTSLAWAEGIALLGMLAGFGLAVAAAFWGLGFGWKIPAGLGLACGGILALSLATSWALAHVAWIIAAVIVLVAGAILWAAKRHLSLAGAARAAWRQVPDSVSLEPHVERLLDQVAKS